MTRRVTFVIAVLMVLCCAGLGVWAWYLSGRTAEEADQASSVLGGFAAVVFGVMGVVFAVAGSARAARRRARRVA